MPRYVGVTLGPVEGDDGPTLEADATLEAAPPVLFDALVLPGGAQAVETLAKAGQTMEFVKDQYRHRNGDAQRRARAGLSRAKRALAQPIWLSRGERDETAQGYGWRGWKFPGLHSRRR